jgi:hypothetical protein
MIPGFAPLAMASRNDCGPTALFQALEALGRLSAGARAAAPSRGELLRLWGLCEGRRFTDRLDTPGRHLRALRRLGVPFACRRRLGRTEIEAALAAERPVVLLAPTGPWSWHWVVACGAEEEAVVLSCGDGRLRSMEWEAMADLRRRHPLSRALRTEGLGYALGLPRPFAHDGALERDMLRLAAFAEEALRPLEAALGPAASLSAALSIRDWKGRAAAGMISTPAGGARRIAP